MGARDPSDRPWNMIELVWMATEKYSISALALRMDGDYFLHDPVEHYSCDRSC